MDETEIRLRCLEMAIRMGAADPVEKAREFIEFVTKSGCDDRVAYNPNAVDKLVDAIAEENGTTRAAIYGHARNAMVMRARHKAIAAVHRAFPDFSYVELGRLFGNRDHTTIISSLRKSGAYHQAIFRLAAE